jgi:DNA-binding transcriptional MerR regulator
VPAPTPTAPGGGWSVAAAADRVGVSASTLRSWERRYGLGPQGRTAGGHRRYTSADVAVLQQVRRLVETGMPAGAAAAAVRGHPATTVRPTPCRTDVFAPDTAAQRFLDAAYRLNARAAERLARQLLIQRGTVAAWNDVFAPLLQDIGRNWEHTGGGVECEHLIAGVLQTALDRHAAQHRTTRHRRTRTGTAPDLHAGVLLAAAPEEAHTLPLYASAAALAEDGIGSWVFGTLPPDALHAAIDQLAPTAVLLWARSRNTANTRLLRQLRRAAPVVCAAGIGWPARVAAPIVGTRDLQSTVDLLRMSVHTGEPARAGA